MQELEHGNGTISNTMLSSGLEMRLKLLHGVMDRTDCRKLENAMLSPFLLPPIKREDGLN